MFTKEQILDVFEHRDGGLYRKNTGKRGYKRPDGYVYSRLFGKAVGEHRLIHFLSSGEWPQQVDHINGIKDDNRTENLRSANNQQNSMNRVNARTKRKGCYWQEKRKRWMVQIGVDGKRKTIGYYKTLKEAKKAYNESATKYFGEYAACHKISTGHPTLQTKGEYVPEGLSGVPILNRCRNRNESIDFKDEGNRTATAGIKPSAPPYNYAQHNRSAK